MRLPTLLATPFAILMLTTALPAAQAGDVLKIQAAQLKSLGIVSSNGQGEAAGNSRLPAKVVVPNAQMRILAAPVAGMVAQLAVAPGMAVKRGQVLALLASPQALELQRDALQSGSQAALLQQNLKRDEALFAEGLIAESRLQATRAAAAQAGAAAEQGRQSLALAGIAGGRMGGSLALTANIDGVVLEQKVQLGQRVEAATPLYTLARLSPLWLEIQAPVEVAAGLREGAALKVAGSEVSGKLIAVGRAVDAASQTVLLRAEISKGAESLRPGQVCEVEISGSAGNLRSLPAAALARIDRQAVVFVQTAGDEQGAQFVRKPVRVVAQGGNSITVEGLNADERVAIKGVSALKAMATGVGGE
ncbi:MAG: efflux RND transporter periplasmic adaptor subunit [Rhodocyclales bacterium]|nr:efflux RND transporter periplasmic adaptor subunit [Rhodocyclales bacterium]